MTDIEARLTAAWWDALAGFGHIDVDRGSYGVPEERATVHEFIAAILATPSMQAIARDAELGRRVRDNGLCIVTKDEARQAAIGAAVERLADAVAWTLRGGPDGDPTEAWNTQTGAVGTGSTIPEAIAAALGDDDE